MHSAFPSCACHACMHVELIYCIILCLICYACLYPHALTEVPDIAGHVPPDRGRFPTTTVKHQLRVVPCCGPEPGVLHSSVVH